MLDVYPKILFHFSKPRYNLWPYFLAQQQKHDGVQHVYVGEGGDEHFGGYWYKPKKTYVEHWSSFFEYMLPTYKTIYERMFGLHLEIPMHPRNLSVINTLPYYDSSQHKKLLKEAYKDVLPKQVLMREKHNGRFSYEVIWEKELCRYYPDADPQTEEEIKALLDHHVTSLWLRIHNPVVHNECECKILNY